MIKKSWPFLLVNLFIAAAALYLFWPANETAALPAAQTAVPSDETAVDNPLFQPAVTSLARAEESDVTVLRSQFVTVDVAQLQMAQVGTRITLNLFDDVVETAVVERIEQNPSGSTTWIGVLENNPLSQVLFVLRQDRLAAHIFTTAAAYDINAVDNATALHEISQMALQTLDSEQDDMVIETLPLSPEARVASDNGDVIDLMVLYSDDVTDLDIVSEIELAVAYTNQAYANSGISQRVFLVHTEQITYVETGDLGLDLPALRNDGDGNIDQIHTLRDTYHADLVMLLVEDGNGDPNSCSGLAYLQVSIASVYEQNGFSTMESCFPLGINVFAHELGHNMGARHDWYVDADTTPFDYAHGYVNVAGGWRTIMSYSNLCTALGGSCPRVPHFSNPNVAYNGAATGVSANTGSTSCTVGNSANPLCKADVRQTLNNSANNTAGYRLSQATWMGATSSDWNDATNWTINEGDYTGYTAVSRTPRLIDDVLIPSSPTSGRFPTISADTSFRNVTIETGATLTVTSGSVTVSGDFDVQGTGQFAGTGGTLIFASMLDQEVTPTSASSFNNVQFGNGSSQTISLNGDMSISGDVTINSGPAVDGNSHTFTIGGDWNDLGLGFEPDSSTVIFDGSTQSISGTAEQVLLTEDFSFAEMLTPGSFYFSSQTGWTEETNGNTSYGWVFANPNWGPGSAGDGQATRIWQSGATATADDWLFSPGQTLQAGISYRLRYDIGTVSASSNEDLEVNIGASPNSAAMTTQLANFTSFTSTNWSSQEVIFTVPSDGIYYIGFHTYTDPVDGNDSIALDDVELARVSGPQFYNVMVNSSDAATVNAAIQVNNNLTINGVLATSSMAMAVEGSVVNNGRFRQTLDVPNGVATELGAIRTASGSTVQHYGVIIEPLTGSMGSTIVTVRGGQTCGNGGNLSGSINRCFEIEPATAQTAEITFYYLSSELNGIAAPTVNFYHYMGSGSWEVETTAARGSTGMWQWVRSSGVDAYSPFAGSAAEPTAVGLADFSLANDDGSITAVWFIIGALSLLLTLTRLWHEWRQKIGLIQR